MICTDDAFEYPQADRIVVIGDIHGDIRRFKNILIDASIINNDLEWIAQPQNTIVLQIGDQIDSLDRVPDAETWEILPDINMLYLTNSLNKIAMTKGGRVISLIGNHEVMNIMGNFSYVSSKSNFSSRQKYFEPKGTLSPILANMKIVVKIGDLLFCHAGIRKHHLDFLKSKNIHISQLNAMWKKFMLTNIIYEDEAQIFNKLLLNDDSILWTREPDTHEDLEYVMNQLKCEFMFVGHSPVDKIQLIQSKIWYIDSYISRAFGATSYQYVDIIGTQINVKTINEKNDTHI